jgi:Family of unknown function (DUF6062)
MGRHTPFFELQVALGEAGCPICTLTVRALARYFDGLVYEKVNDGRIRGAIRRAQGLCAAHGVMLREARSALGVAIIQRDVLRAATAALASAATDDTARSWRATLFGGAQRGGLATPDGPCVGCAFADETASHWVNVLGQHYGELRSLYQASGGLCLDHLRAALAVAPEPAAAALRDDQRAIWARLEAELDEFIRKHDHQFADEPVGPERNAWARATDLLAGDWRVNGSKRAQ